MWQRELTGFFKEFGEGEVRYLFLLLLCSCSLQQGQATTPTTIKHLNIINPLACSDSLREADAYLESHGIRLIADNAAAKTLVCLPTPSWVMRVLSPLYVGGMTQGKVAWVTDDTKLLLHEWGHLEGLQHGYGVMAPIDILQIFATGFTNEQFLELKNDQ